MKRRSSEGGRNGGSVRCGRKGGEWWRGCGNEGREMHDKGGDTHTEPIGSPALLF